MKSLYMINEDLTKITMVNKGNIYVPIIFVCFTTIILMYIAANNVLFDLEENGCEMTYMFEYPKYIRMKLKTEISKKYPRYGLYLYGEGQYAQELRRSKPNGIPVLFIPGNAGSYQQVRSLASVALRKAESHTNHFNYFTIDFDEDLSGLYGGLLMDQVDFVHSCLRYIIRMYQGNTIVPESVIVIGHSMGGMIARALFTLDNFQSKLVSIIITLGTPNVMPIIPFDTHLNSFYFKVNNFWKNNSTARNISVISLAGGARDILVPAGTTSLPHNVQSKVQDSAVTTAVPDIWLTIDHLALCWCKQLILVINRALFSLIDEDTNKITNNTILQEQVLRRYFGLFNEKSIETVPAKRAQKSYRKTMPYNETDLGHRFREISMSGTAWIVLNPDVDAQFVALSKSWGDIFILNVESVDVESGTSGNVVSFQATPMSKEKAGFFQLTKGKDTSLILVYYLQESSPLAMQFLPKSDINKHFSNFGIFSGVQTFSSSNNLFINISLPMIRNFIDAYLITVKKVNCENENGDIFAGRVHVPWSREDVYARSSQSAEFTIPLKVHTWKRSSELAQLHVWKTYRCSLEVTIEYQFIPTLGRIFTLFAPSIPRWLYSWIMIALFIQLRQMSDEDGFLSIDNSVGLLWKYTLNFISLYMPLILLCVGVLKVVLKSSLRWNDFISQSWNTDSLFSYDCLLPTSFMILAALVIFQALYIVVEIILTSLTWLLLLRAPKNNHPAPRGTSSLAWIRVYICLLVLSFCFISICSSIVIYFLIIVIFISCFEATAKSRQRLNLIKLMLVLVLVVSFQTTPAFVVWLKVLRSSWYLPSDPFKILAVFLAPNVLCLCAMQVHKPRKYAPYIILSMWFVGFLVCSLDWLPYVVALILMAVNLFVFGKRDKTEKNH